MPIHPNVRRCIHVKLNSQPCGSPAVTGKARCFHHEEVVRRRTMRKLPFIRNAADLQQAVMDVIQGMLERRLVHREATAILYALQLAQGNIKTSGFRGGMETVHESNGSLVHHLLAGLDEVTELEAEIPVTPDEAQLKEWEESLKRRKEFMNSYSPAATTKT